MNRFVSAQSKPDPREDDPVSLSFFLFVKATDRDITNLFTFLSITLSATNSLRQQALVYSPLSPIPLLSTFLDHWVSFSKERKRNVLYQLSKEGHYHARPYQAGYYIREPHRHQHAVVTRDHGGAVAGRYGYLDARGIGRQVNYVADHAGLRARVHTNEPAAVLNTPVVAARIASDSVAARGVAVVPAYDSVLGYGSGVNGYGLGYDGYGLDYGYPVLGYGYGGALGYTGFLGSYGGVHV
ncbi:hypothetical protein AVEN_2236-1 [Araneus ventricosus]|uniref:Cuticle protein 16.8 n=1 Tax=Araneus ventricosus TaxID=182803 RepID=A0A4Y2RI26_ARAVE|nr:hypothetical protein AVEN_2236-1 [Araneus ventricosus]